MTRATATRILFAAGTFGPVDTNKVLTFQGVGAGTTTSSAGATVIQRLRDQPSRDEAHPRRHGALAACGGRPPVPG